MSDFNSIKHFIPVRIRLTSSSEKIIIIFAEDTIFFSGNDCSYLLTVRPVIPAHLFLRMLVVSINHY